MWPNGSPSMMYLHGNQMMQNTRPPLHIVGQSYMGLPQSNVRMPITPLPQIMQPSIMPINQIRPPMQQYSQLNNNLSAGQLQSPLMHQSLPHQMPNIQHMDQSRIQAYQMQANNVANMQAQHAQQAQQMQAQQAQQMQAQQAQQIQAQQVQQAQQAQQAHQVQQAQQAQQIQAQQAQQRGQIQNQQQIPQSIPTATWPQGNYPSMPINLPQQPINTGISTLVQPTIVQPGWGLKQPDQSKSQQLSGMYSGPYLQNQQQMPGQQQPQPQSQPQQQPQQQLNYYPQQQSIPLNNNPALQQSDVLGAPMITGQYSQPLPPMNKMPQEDYTPKVIVTNQDRPHQQTPYPHTSSMSNQFISPPHVTNNSGQSRQQHNPQCTDPMCIHNPLSQQSDNQQMQIMPQQGQDWAAVNTSGGNTGVSTAYPTVQQKDQSTNTVGCITPGLYPTFQQNNQPGAIPPYTQVQSARTALLTHQQAANSQTAPQPTQQIQPHLNMGGATALTAISDVNFSS